MSTDPSGRLIVASVRPHYAEIVKFINEHVDRIPLSTTFEQLGDDKIFFIIYWIIFTCFAVSTVVLYDLVNKIEKNITYKQIKNKIYCMQLAGWVNRVSYSGKDYFFTCYEKDPFDYSFRENVAENDSIRRKTEVRDDMKQNFEKIPKHVRELVATSRRPSKK